MKKNQSKHFSFSLLLFSILGLLVIIAGSFLVYEVSSKNEHATLGKSNSSSSRTTFTSNLNFSIDVPEDVKVDEGYTGVSLLYPEGKIIIGRTGTNYRTLDEYLSDLSKKNSFNLSNKESFEINSLPAAKLKVGNRLDYFIYGTEWTIYTFSTDSEALYGDLDQIATSFRYTP